MPDKEDAKAVMRCDMIFSCAEDMDSSNPIVNVYRDEVFAAKKAEYVAAAQKQIPCIKKLLEQREGERVSIYYVINRFSRFVIVTVSLTTGNGSDGGG